MYVVVAVEASGVEHVSSVPLIKEKAEEYASLIALSDQVVHTEVRSLDGDVDKMLEMWIVNMTHGNK